MVRRFDRHIVNLADSCGAAVDIDVVFELADLRGAGRQNQILRIHGVDDIERGQAFRLERGRLDIDHHLALLAAVGPRHGRPGHGRELRADKIRAEIVQLLFGQALTGERQLENGNGGGVKGHDEE